MFFLSFPRALAALPPWPGEGVPLGRFEPLLVIRVDLLELLQPGRWAWTFGDIPSGYVKIAIENCHLQCGFPWKIVIFHSYVKLLKGINSIPKTDARRWCVPAAWCQRSLVVAFRVDSAWDGTPEGAEVLPFSFSRSWPRTSDRGVAPHLLKPILCISWSTHSLSECSLTFDAEPSNIVKMVPSVRPLGTLIWQMFDPQHPDNLWSWCPQLIDFLFPINS